MRLFVLRPALAAFLIAFARAAAAGEAATSSAFDPKFGPDWSIHGQTTLLWQGYPKIRSPYEGPNSLPGVGQGRETWTGTAYIGRRLWDGAEVFINPELDQGFGIGKTVGLGGFSNGEAQKGGSVYPVLHVHRAFFRQTLGFGGEQEKVSDDLNQFAGKRDVSRLTVTVGKFSVTDIFNDNAYSHDPRTTFMNWSIYEAGAFDYAADKLGFTWGAVADFNQKNWALRAGYFLLPREPNVNEFDMDAPRRGGAVAELETRYALFGQPGKLRLLGFANTGNAGSYRETLANPQLNLEIDQTRRTRTKYGFVINAEQAISNDLGIFSRASWNDGRSEIMSFTDIDASLSLGAALKGTRWGRPDDTVGLGGAVNALSAAHRDFIAAGGLGVLIGDGQLKYSEEKVAEIYYSFALRAKTSLTFDYQFIANPAYNADRGPVSIFSSRVHAEF